MPRIRNQGKDNLLEVTKERKAATKKLCQKKVSLEKTSSKKRHQEKGLNKNWIPQGDPKKGLENKKSKNKGLKWDPDGRRRSHRKRKST